MHFETDWSLQLVMAVPRCDDWGGGGGREPVEVDSFHVTPIGIMVNVENIAGDCPGCPPPPLLSLMAAGLAFSSDADDVIFRLQAHAMLFVFLVPSQRT